MTHGYLVLETGEAFEGQYHGEVGRAGEVVFNTSHSGYEEMATDPSYFNQILITTAPMQGNYGESDEVWESKNIRINGFVSLELQNSKRDSSWRQKLLDNSVPILTGLDTRKIVLHLREKGTTWGALVKAENSSDALTKANSLIDKTKGEESDWAYRVSVESAFELSGNLQNGLKVAVLDFGCKQNIIRELQKRCEFIKVFPSRTGADEIKSWQPHGILLSNGPGNPEDVQQAVETLKKLLGWRFVFGICMGHQLLSLALDAKTYKLPFGHRGSNHPIKDELRNKIYMTSQNHGYAVERESLPSNVEITHTNLNDKTVSGIMCEEKKCMSVQFHPESHPGPHDAEGLFDYFVKKIQ